MEQSPGLATGQARPAAGAEAGTAVRLTRAESFSSSTPPDESRANSGGGNLSPGGVALPPHLHIRVPLSPLEMMLSYQRAWQRDDWMFKVGLAARQIGKDYQMAGEGITEIFAQESQKLKHPGWLLAAPSERQSIESLEKWKEWTEAYHLVIADVIEEREDPRNSESLLKSSTIVFPQGSRVVAVPGKPSTVRGFSMNIAGTEFAFFDQPDETLRALMPSITNPLRGGKKKIRLFSTPNGAGTKFHDLCSKAITRFLPPSPGGEGRGEGGPRVETPEWQAAIASGRKGLWSLHRVTIHEAVAMGLPVDIEELRAALDDPEGWAQEYECSFLDLATVLLPYELIIPCENPLATNVAPAGFWEAAHFTDPVDLGIDFGRKRDLTVSWALQTIGGAFRMTREVLELSKMSTPDQIEILRLRIQKARRVAFDYTGPGTGMGDYLVKEFGEWNPEKHKFGKIELCTFSNTLKVDIFPKTRMAFEAKTLGIPVSRIIREDLHSVSRVALAGGGVTYRAPHTDDGHADRCTALALALRAGSGVSANFFSALI